MSFWWCDGFEYSPFYIVAWRDVVVSGVHLSDHNVGIVVKLKKKNLFLNMVNSISAKKMSSQCIRNLHKQYLYVSCCSVSYVLPAHFLSKLCIFRFEFLAVATPRGIKLNQYIFLWIIYNLLKRVCNHHLDRNPSKNKKRKDFHKEVVTNTWYKIIQTCLRWSINLDSINMQTYCSLALSKFACWILIGSHILWRNNTSMWYVQDNFH